MQCVLKRYSQPLYCLQNSSHIFLIDSFLSLSLPHFNGIIVPPFLQKDVRLMSQTFTDILEAASHLPVDQRRQLAAELMKDSGAQTEEHVLSERAAALQTVDDLYGSIKGLDRQTLIWLAEDEELCGS